MTNENYLFISKIYLQRNIEISNTLKTYYKTLIDKSKETYYNRQLIQDSRISWSVSQSLHKSNKILFDTEKELTTEILIIPGEHKNAVCH